MALLADARMNEPSLVTLRAVTGIATPTRHGRDPSPASGPHDMVVVGEPTKPWQSAELAGVYDRVGAWCYSVAYQRWGDSPATAEAVEEAFMWLRRIAPRLNANASLEDVVKLRMLQTIGSAAAGSQSVITVQDPRAQEPAPALAPAS